MSAHPGSRTLFRAGMIAFVLSVLLQIPGRLQAGFHPDVLDGLRGGCLGIFIGAMAAIAWRNWRPRAC